MWVRLLQAIWDAGITHYYTPWRSDEANWSRLKPKSHLTFQILSENILARRRYTMSICEHDLLIDFRLK
jgi:hypothetical protein